MAITAIVVVINGVAAIAKASLPDSNIKNNNILLPKRRGCSTYIPSRPKSPNALRNHQLRG